MRASLTAIVSPASRRVFPIVIFRSIDELDALCQAKMRWRRAHLFLRIPELPGKQVSQLETALNKRFNDCGCSMGARFVLLALAGSVLWQFWHSDWSILGWPWFLARTLSVMILAGGIGKLFGIKNSRLALSTFAISQRGSAQSAKGLPSLQRGQTRIPLRSQVATLSTIASPGATLKLRTQIVQ